MYRVFQSVAAGGTQAKDSNAALTTSREATVSSKSEEAASAIDMFRAASRKCSAEANLWDLIIQSYPQRALRLFLTAMMPPTGQQQRCVSTPAHGHQCNSTLEKAAMSKCKCPTTLYFVRISQDLLQASTASPPTLPGPMKPS